VGIYWLSMALVMQGNYSTFDEEYNAISTLSLFFFLTGNHSLAQRPAHQPSRHYRPLTPQPSRFPRTTKVVNHPCAATEHSLYQFQSRIVNPPTQNFQPGLPQRDSNPTRPKGDDKPCVGKDTAHRQSPALRVRCKCEPTPL
jgi:hypothetical protein